jgi:toxin-antitoxin system PIN domain toxin
MPLLDVNVVLALHRVDHAQHVVAFSWFDELLGRGGSFSVPTVIWGSFVRIATNRRAFRTPTPLPAVFDFIEDICAQPGYLPTTPGPRHLSLLRDVCESSEAEGDLVPDAVLAALALEYGSEIVTFDRDFARFTSIRHQRLSG